MAREKSDPVARWVAVLGVFAAFASAAVAIVAIVSSERTAEDQRTQQATVAEDQQALEEAVIERESAPVMAFGAGPSEAGSPTTVHPQSAKPIEKPADRLWLKADRVIVPVRNVGSGVGFVVGPPRLPRDCNFDRGGDAYSTMQFLRREIPLTRLGYYNVVAGEAAQLFFWADDSLLLSEVQAAHSETSAHVLLRYTDALATRDRWSCFDLSRSAADDKHLWRLDANHYTVLPGAAGS